MIPEDACGHVCPGVMGDTMFCKRTPGHEGGHSDGQAWWTVRAPLPTVDPVVASRYFDSDGRAVELRGGVWCDRETGARAEPALRQVIRESAWTDDLRIRA